MHSINIHRQERGQCHAYVFENEPLKTREKADGRHSGSRCGCCWHALPPATHTSAVCSSHKPASREACTKASPLPCAGSDARSEPCRYAHTVASSGACSTRAASVTRLYLPNPRVASLSCPLSPSAVANSRQFGPSACLQALSAVWMLKSRSCTSCTDVTSGPHQLGYTSRAGSCQ